MRFCIEFESDGPLLFPKEYNHAVQGMIYHLLATDVRSFLHDSGFGWGGRTFKLFTFSRLLGRFKTTSDKFVFERHVKLWISSPLENLISELANSLVRKGEVDLCGNKLRVVAINVPKKPDLTSIIYRTLSPVTVYSTLMKADGRKKTYYYSPLEPEFSELASENLVKKASIIAGKKITGKVEVKPLHEKSCREVICMFKGTVIRAWEGFFRVSGDFPLIEAMYEAGLGSKNSSGFGMVEVVRKC